MDDIRDANNVSSICETRHVLDVMPGPEMMAIDTVLNAILHSSKITLEEYAPIVVVEREPTSTPVYITSYAWLANSNKKKIFFTF